MMLWTTVDRTGIWPFRDAEVVAAQHAAADKTRHLSLQEVLALAACGDLENHLSIRDDDTTPTQTTRHEDGKTGGL